MTDDHFRLSRRTVLASLGTTGTAAVGAGLGTSALFSDREPFDNDRLVTGELDAKVGWSSHYSDWSPDEAAHAHVADGELVVDDPRAFLDATLRTQFPDAETRRALDADDAVPCEAFADVPDDPATPRLDLADVKPGDFGMIAFDLLLCDNPGYVWLTGSLDAATENGWSEPETDSPLEDGSTESGGVELLDAIRVRIRNGGRPLDGGVVFEGTLAETLDTLGTGYGHPLDGDPGTAAADTGETRSCFAPTPTRHGVTVEWWLPVDVGDAVQGDSVTLDLGFYTEQCRRNDGTGTGCDGSVPADGETVVCETRFELLDERGDGAASASVSVDGSSAAVTGVIVGDNGCYAAALDAVIVEDDTLVVAVESYEDALPGGGCSGALVFLEYEATVELRGDRPEAVRVDHDDHHVTTVEWP
jgi:hypothetical protein